MLASVALFSCRPQAPQSVATGDAEADADDDGEAEDERLTEMFLDAVRVQAALDVGRLE